MKKKLYCLDRDICSYQRYYSLKESKEIKPLFTKCPICGSLAVNINIDFHLKQLSETNFD